MQECILKIGISLLYLLSSQCTRKCSLWLSRVTSIWMVVDFVSTDHRAFSIDHYTMICFKYQFLSTYYRMFVCCLLDNVIL